MSKTTAVEYLVKELGDILDARFIKPMQDLLIVNAVNKAKKLEREQIEDAYLEGCNNTLGIEVALADDIENATNYYQTEYGGQHDPN
jgi:hypothetical protein